MKIKFYGTAAYEGVPALFCKCDVCTRSKKDGGKNIRTRSQALVDGKILIDFPADTYLHQLYMGLPLSDIAHCLVTHTHCDHFYPEDLEARSTVYTHGMSESLTVYGTDKVGAALAPFMPNLASENRVIFKEIKPFEPFGVMEYKITPLAANHSPASGPVIFMIEKDNKALLYANDTGYFPDQTWRYLETVRPRFDLIALDCTCANPIRNGHMSPAAASEVRERLKLTGCLKDNAICCLNHFSHNNGQTYDDITKSIPPQSFTVTYDGMEIDF